MGVSCRCSKMHDCQLSALRNLRENVGATLGAIKTGNDQKRPKVMLWRKETRGTIKEAQTNRARLRMSVRQSLDEAGWWQVCKEEKEEEEDGGEEQT